MTDTRLLVWGTIDKKSDKTQLIIDDCREIDNLNLLLILIVLKHQMSEYKIPKEAIKFKPEKVSVNQDSSFVLIKNKNIVTYVKFGEQFFISDIKGVQIIGR